MSRFRMILPILIIMSLGLIIGCSDDDKDPVDPTPTAPTMTSALEDYWTVQTDISGSLTEMNLTWDSIAAALGDKSASEEDIDELVDQFVAQSEAAAANYDAMIALEDAIMPNQGNKGMFTNAAKAVVVGIYNTGKNVVVSAGQQVRTGWRVLSGKQTIREALRDPDSGIPIISGMAKRLKEHNDQRDNAIVNSITTGDSQEGWVPINDLEGATPAERAQAYRNLPDDHPLKKQMRGDVHFWHVGEKAATVVTLKKAAQDQIKNYAGAVSGSDVMVEIGDQMTNPNQAPTDKGTLKSALKDADSAQLVADKKTMIIVKRGQPEHEQKIAVMEGVDADFEADLPTGTYDVIVMAEDFVRSVATEVQIAAGAINDVLLDMHDRVSNSLILESVTSNTATIDVGGAAQLTAIAASTIGQTLTFSWEADGPAQALLSTNNHSAVFKSSTVGQYTVTCTVSDNMGNEKSETVEIEVVGGLLEITGVTVGDGDFADEELNPGETVMVTLDIANQTAESISSHTSLSARGPISIISPAIQDIVLDGGASTSWPVTIQLPVDYSQAEAVLIWTTEVGDAVFEQEIVLPVSFWVEIDPIETLVTERILNVTGRVANPALTSAHLVVDGEVGQVFEVLLSDGEFNQDIALEGAPGERDITITLTADCGGWREEAVETFAADIPAAGIRVTLTWNTAGTDVDLWVTDPDGEKCYYDHETTLSGLMLDVDDTNGYGPENITNQSPPAGDYLVQVHYYDDHDDETAIGSDCTIVVRLNEGTDDEEVRTYSGYLSDTDDIWTVTTLTIGEKSGYAFQDDGDVSVFSGMLPVK
jgi:uncharacterized protein YfaP (DUF2135 family)